MKISSIQTKYLALVLSGIIISALVIGVICALNASRIARVTSAQNMNLICDGFTDEADTSLRSIEHSVSMTGTYAMELLDSVDRLSADDAYRKDYTKQLNTLLTTVANDTERVAVYYVRYAPELCSTDVGFLYCRSNAGEAFQEYPLTVIENYDPDDVGHVGWYYIPINNYTRHGTKISWLEPYYNDNLNILMISCVMPLFKDGRLAGIVGMDIDFQQYVNDIKEIEATDDLKASICNNDGRVYYYPEIYDLQETASRGEGGSAEAREKAAETIYLQDIMPGYSPGLETSIGSEELFEGQDPQTAEPVKFATSTLSNGMHLVLSAPSARIDANVNFLIAVTAAVTVVLIVFFVVVTVVISRSIIRPLRRLNEAAGQIAQGNLDIELEVQGNDEVAELTRSFQTTADELKKYTDSMRDLAYRDSLTHVRNATAYEAETKRLADDIGAGTARFAIGMFDVNDLKYTNDTYGHAQGDKLITAACQRICNCFKHSPVFRIGGDEFVAIIEGADYERLGALLEEFDATSTRENGSPEGADGKVSVAKGVAVFDAETDTCVEDVFERADALMYENKTDMKTFLT